MKGNLLRWIPAVMAPVLVAATAVGLSVSASATVDLPDKSASEILQLINTDPDIAFSGRVLKKAALGLPPMNLMPDVSQASVDQMSKSMPKEMMEFLPRASARGELALVLEFFAGVHRANIYVDGVDKARLQVLDQISERNFIRNGSDLWFYDANKAMVRHSVIDPTEEAAAKKDALSFFNTQSALLPFDATSPAAVADYFLAQAGPQTSFSVGKDAKIAGRGVYQITATPRTAGTLVASVTIAVDAATGLPMAVAVRSVGSATPAFEVSFETISFAKPDAANFNFVVPPGTKVEKLPAPTRQSLEKLAAGKAPTLADRTRAEAEAQKLIAQGWAAVAQIPAEMVPAQFAELKVNKLFTELTKPVAGGRIFSTTLLNIFIAEDGRIFAGSVTPQRLLEAASK